ncbi:sulfite reductase (NADPH) hemoprotein beta-component [Formivibrio citricus]|uniref:Sulfite reductase (NADPH) hemoprotein beta-component n=1 Tax=Formivibrio citricus TaxID=83765 RepID=A0A1I4XPW5_9NEIS|nr:nitrite/sulfite reductase [Formivibrio citricus]SFN27463.1 sulfite reductase (NADPH) hemoprotein beta-component [Formivibrio citricus]
MYRYDHYDQKIVDERVVQFRDQVRRFRNGELSNEEFLPLRLQNGLYMQRHAHMLRVAIPYGLLSSRQLRALADIATRYDRGYAHFTTRQNVQFNWPELDDAPEILAELAKVQMHAIQTSGNCVRNVTSDQFAGVAPDEIVDPRPYCELLRQWSTFHPEFAHLPRKFKIAVSGTEENRVALTVHDIGLQLYKDVNGETLIRVIVGGGLGRTPIIGSVVREDLPWPHLFTYVEAILRVYNRFGRRDNKYKARIKILLKALGVEAFAAEVEKEWAHLKDGPATLTGEELARVAGHFTDPLYETLPATDAGFEQHKADNVAFARWVSRSVRAHKQPGYASVTLSLKPTGTAPGDLTAEQMQQVADWADQFSFGELRVTHEQNLALADVRLSDLFSLWKKAKAAGLATPNIGLATDIIACPGGDFCSLANARSIPLAQAIQEQIDDFDYLFDIGDISINISGCMNSCSHHHVGHIGILGVDKNGEEFYQLTLGGHAGHHAGQRREAALGKVIGPSLSAQEVPPAVDKLLRAYLLHRIDGERFIDTVDRLGADPFKFAVYGADAHRKEAAHG